MKILKSDSEASRRQQGKFILAENLLNSDADLEKLQAAIDGIDKTDSIMSPKRVAALGPLNRQYLAYQRLSDGAAHPTAKSLEHQMIIQPGRTGWCYRFGIGEADEITATMHHLALAAIPIGVGITQMFDNKPGNSVFAKLADRFVIMPQGKVI